MTNRRSLSEPAKLELYKIALTNAKTQVGINQSLVSIGFSNKVLEEGSKLYSQASKAYHDANKARVRRSVALKIYVQKVKVLEELFRIDWKIAKIAFLNDSLAKSKLELDKRFEQGRLKQFEMAMTFYMILLEKPELLESLANLGLTAERVTERLEILSLTEKARASYITEKGNSLNATIVKKNAMKSLSKWMTQFFSIARNALKNEPHMMQSLGLLVKN